MQKLRFVVSCFLVFGFAQAAPVPEGQKQSEFIRVETKEGKTSGLSTAIVTYRKNDVSVDLVGAVHFGDKEYYKELNSRFKDYDAVLYEMVAPANVRPVRRQKTLLGSLAKIFLELESQVESIDYKRQNFIHADLDFNGLKEDMRKRGEDGMILGLRVMADIMQQQNKLRDNPPITEIIELGGANDALTLKRVFAKQFSKVEGLGLPSLDEIIVKSRNKAALSVLSNVVKDGKKKIAIFYGAAHLPDMEARMLANGYTRKSDQWLKAWDLNDD